MTIRSLDDASFARWNEFVLAHPASTFFHLAEWKTVLERAFGHATHFLFAEENGRIRGVLPLGRIRSRLFGDTLISIPFGVYGGILADGEASHHALEREARDLAETLQVDCLEMRNRVRAHPGWPCKDLYVTFRKELDPDPEQNLLRIPRRQRAMVRKGIKAGLAAVLDDGIERFYPMYAESVRNLGTPVFSRRYFRLLREVFGGACEVLTVLHEGQPVSSVMSFYFRDEVLPYYGGGKWEARDLAANDFMYWNVMRRACERGVRIFDYGRSKRNTGSYGFKHHWGFEPEPLYYECALVRATAVPEVNPLNPKYRLFVEAWKRLPLGVCNLVGPVISRNLG